MTTSTSPCISANRRSPNSRLVNFQPTHPIGSQTRHHIVQASPYIPLLQLTQIDPYFTHRKQVYQVIASCTNWLATCNRPDIAPALIFLASCINDPHQQHCKAPIHALKYLTSTNEYVIFFRSNSYSTIHTFNHFPHHHEN